MMMMMMMLAQSCFLDHNIAGQPSIPRGSQATGHLRFPEQHTIRMPQCLMAQDVPRNDLNSCSCFGCSHLIDLFTGKMLHDIPQKRRFRSFWTSKPSDFLIDSTANLFSLKCLPKGSMESSLSQGRSHPAKHNETWRNGRLNWDETKRKELW